MTSSVAKTRIGIISLSRFLDDPRVRRQCDVLHAAGFHVSAIGEDDDRIESVGWTVMSPSSRGSSQAIEEFFNLRAWRAAVGEILGSRARKVVKGIILATRAQLSRIDAGYARARFLSWNDKVNDLYEKAKPLKCDIWLANDWIALPVAARLAAENGGFYVYDSHEFALEEYQERFIWRLVQKPIVAAIEKGHIGDAKLVSTVSSGIADRLKDIYRLSCPVITVRNTPNYVAIPFRATPEIIRVLYHGIVAPGRGLEAAIDSVTQWTTDRHLYIRGPGSKEYLNSIRKRIEDAKLQSRVFLLPPVPMIELVTAAAEFDVGFFALPGHSLHNEFALPNKFFEYAMAGLALCVSDLTEMSSLLKEYGLGTTFANVAPDMIAAAINDLSRKKIDRFKRNALEAAKRFCWEAESQNFVSALNSLVKAEG